MKTKQQFRSGLKHAETPALLVELLLNRMPELVAGSASARYRICQRIVSGLRDQFEVEAHQA
jgi:hypothetical protein